MALIAHTSWSTWSPACMPTILSQYFIIALISTSCLLTQWPHSWFVVAFCVFLRSPTYNSFLWFSLTTTLSLSAHGTNITAAFFHSPPQCDHSLNSLLLSRPNSSIVSVLDAIKCDKLNALFFYHFRYTLLDHHWILTPFEIRWLMQTNMVKRGLSTSVADWKLSHNSLKHDWYFEGNIKEESRDVSLLNIIDLLI